MQPDCFCVLHLTAMFDDGCYHWSAPATTRAPAGLANCVAMETASILYRSRLCGGGSTLFRWPQLLPLTSARSRRPLPAVGHVGFAEVSLLTAQWNIILMIYMPIFKCLYFIYTIMIIFIYVYIQFNFSKRPPPHINHIATLSLGHK